MVVEQTCSRCVMDTSDRDIDFDSKGVCSYCREATRLLPKYHFTKDEEKVNLAKLADTITKRRKGEYDSIIGLSGGVDSSYVAYLAWKLGLKPLCVHFDNGWNSEISVSNINKIIEITGFDFTTYVIDWPEFRDLQRSFVKAGVIDIEMLTDHAIWAAMFRICRKNRIAFVLTGTNYTSEHGMPRSWLWRKQDLRNIKAIHGQFGERKLKSFPVMGSLRFAIAESFAIGGTGLQPLNLINYRKTEAMEVLKTVFGWRYYGGKHYESIFTKFYQAFILPEKFGVDKRRAHLSALIRNDEMTRDEAIAELAKPLYDLGDLKQDKEYVLKKLGFSEQEFSSFIKAPPVPHDFYPSDAVWIHPLMAFKKRLIRSGFIRGNDSEQ
ncbi:MAG: N-acetyl sugar amidotransferase [Proteobacteria bacterium]|nr:N-acetyl sugar amidotransferase [Pseudomonadota bacterium]MBU1688681.1 N-acetyl sugar amidotransferase [Pseudomonadota bacterium]